LIVDKNICKTPSPLELVIKIRSTINISIIHQIKGRQQKALKLVTYAESEEPDYEDDITF
jgi:hypothetical protein